MPCRKHRLSPKARFYNSLRSYIITLLCLFIASAIIDDDLLEVFKLLAFWWGAVLMFKFIKLRGLPGTRGWLSDDWFDWINRRHPAKPTLPKRKANNAPGEDYDPLWKDKDMV